LNSHFYDGGFYPNGGASEIALNIIPVIERAGGKVFVRANVTEILHNGSKVTGVKVI
jgi:all-trans-retinol 13,14-reductase